MVKDKETFIDRINERNWSRHGLVVRVKCTKPICRFVLFEELIADKHILLVVEFVLFYCIVVKQNDEFSILYKFVREPGSARTHGGNNVIQMRRLQNVFAVLGLEHE